MLCPLCGIAAKNARVKFCGVCGVPLIPSAPLSDNPHEIGEGTLEIQESEESTDSSKPIETSVEPEVPAVMPVKDSTVSQDKPEDGFEVGSLAESAVTAVSEAVICPQCQLSNEPAAPYCDQCGKSLGVSAKPIVADGPSVPLSLEEQAETEYHTRPSCRINIEVGGGTALGGKDYQEDELFARTIPYPAQNISVSVLINADGIGGNQGGEVFASRAVAGVWSGIRLLLPAAEQQHGIGRHDFFQLLDQLVKQGLPEVLYENEIDQHALSQRMNLQGGGTTLVLAVAICDLEKGHVVLYTYHHGNSRCWIALNDQIRYLSRITDHALPNGVLLSYFGSITNPTGIPSGNSTRDDIWLNDYNSPTAVIALLTDGVHASFDSAIAVETIAGSSSAQAFSNAAVEWGITSESPGAGTDNATVAALFIKKEMISDE